MTSLIIATIMLIAVSTLKLQEASLQKAPAKIKKNKN